MLDLEARPDDARAVATRRIALPTGELDVAVRRDAWPLDALCGFAARDNPRRGFLVVSKLLGRHIAAAPAQMRRGARDLAALIPSDLPGPVLVIGLAETAICLGQTVHAELRARTGRDDICFIHSTRQRLDHPLLCRFEEPHSHASAHLLYRPDLAGFEPPRSLVLVDDELSTGVTLVNLATAVAECWPQVEAICVATLTDWSDGEWLRRMPCPATSVTLLEGSLTWRPTIAVPGSPSFDAAAARLGSVVGHRNLGRLGLRRPLEVDWVDRAGGGPLRIIGTGEFTYPAFLIGEQLERAGRDVVVQATSRSPARLGGAIHSILICDDNYGTGVPNYLYNTDPGDGRETWVVHETGACSIDPRLVTALNARLVTWPA